MEGIEERKLRGRKICWDKKESEEKLRDGDKR